jgi:hypothetical protein
VNCIQQNFVFTWRKCNSTKQARLDYFLLSNLLSADVNKIEVELAYRSGHSPIILHLKKEEFKRDRPFWKFNNSLLKDQQYVNEIKIVIERIKNSMLH